MKKGEKRTFQKNAKTAKGITLVALVITIVVIIILAVVTINFAFGEGGIVKQAQSAADYYANDTKYTEESLSNVTAYLNGVLNGSNIGGGNPPTQTPTDGTFSETEGVNTPKLANNMKLVVYDADNNTWIEDTTKEAYSYKDTAIEGANSSEWANAEVTVDGITSYFVWIPRYAYKIDSTNQTIDIKFIKGTGKETVDGTPCKYASENPTAEDYIVHPAFTDEEENGGWDTQIPGIWVGKYEASLANKADGTNIETNSSTDGNILLSAPEHTDKTIVTKPGYSSWRNITIGNMYTNALAYSTDLQSHMLKNSEWGAVAYLTESKYGRNGTEIGFNDDGYITGGSAETDAIETNADQSTTGNVYGIYDMRGGASERVAAYYNGSTSSNLDNGDSFASNGGPSTKYSTAYTGTNSSSAYKYGDATYETSGWHSDNASFVHLYYPFFSRGGYYNNTASSTGVFYYNSNNGSAYDHYSFRLALVV